MNRIWFLYYFIEFWLSWWLVLLIKSSKFLPCKTLLFFKLSRILSLVFVLTLAFNHIQLLLIKWSIIFITRKFGHLIIYTKVIGIIIIKQFMNDSSDRKLLQTISHVLIWFFKLLLYCNLLKMIRLFFQFFNLFSKFWNWFLLS